MGNDGVSELFPDNNGGGGESPTPSYAYTEVFNRVFPYYLAIGMTYDQFWNEDVELVKFYREAFRLKQQFKEQDLWLQGAYFCEAIGSCFSDPKNPKKYPAEPFGYLSKRKSNQKKVEQKSDNKAKAVMEMFMVNFNKRFEKKGGEENGS